MAIGRLPGFQQTGLLLVIAAIGTFLTLAGGTTYVTTPIVDARTGQVARDDRGETRTRTVQRNKFLNSDNLINGIIKDGSFFAVMAVGATLVIISGGIDLSVGSIYCVAGVTAAMVLHQLGPRGGGAISPALAAAMGIGLCLATAALCGLLNGLMIVALRVHPFIITLGTMQLFRCAALVTTKAEPYGDFPTVFTGLVRFQVFGLNVVPLLVLLVVVTAGGVLLRKFVFGRHVYAVGGNELASLYSGIRVGWIKIGVYTIAGLTAGVAALLALGYYGAAQSDWGKGAELKVIAACVVGGTSLLGGRGTVSGSLLGTIIIFLIINGIDILNIDNNYSDGVIGLVIILAVLLDQVTGRMRGAGRTGGA